MTPEQARVQCVPDMTIVSTDNGFTCSHGPRRPYYAVIGLGPDHASMNLDPRLVSGSPKVGDIVELEEITIGRGPNISYRGPGARVARR